MPGYGSPTHPDTPSWREQCHVPHTMLAEMVRLSLILCRHPCYWCPGTPDDDDRAGEQLGITTNSLQQGLWEQTHF